MEIDPVILQLRVDMARYQRDLAASTRSVDQAFGRQEARVRQLENEMRRSSGAIGNTLKGLAATLATAFSGRELIGLIDSYTRFQNQLRVAGLEGEQLAQVQERLRAVGAQYGVELESLGQSFSRMAQVQSELGASTGDLLRLNEIVAASLKVAGTDAQAASGALLQLSQALGSGVVRAEEFNSILEGALPLAQAAARGIEGMGGSVSRLRAEVAEGNITSQQFFEGVLRGGVETLEQAENATLTLSGAFTSLRNELTLYFGEASKTSGATAALASAISAIAENLDVIIPAIAVVATALAGRFVAGALAGGTALRALSAHLSVATTSLAGTALAARSAGTALLTAFGGPVGLAITGITLALGYAASEAAELRARMAELEQQTASLTGKADQLEQRLRDAGVAQSVLEDAADTAGDELNRMGGEVDALSRLMRALEADSYKTARALAVVARTELTKRRGELERELPEQAFLAGAAAIAGVNLNGTTPAGTEIEEIDRQLGQIDRLDALISSAQDNGVSLSDPSAPPSATATTTPGSNTRTGRNSVDRAAEERAAGLRFQADFLARIGDDQIRAELEVLDAQLAAATNAEDRADLAYEILQAEAALRYRALDDEFRQQQQALADQEGLEDEERTTLQNILEQRRQAAEEQIARLYGARQSPDESGDIVVDGNTGLLFNQAEADLAQTRLRLEQDAMRMRADTLRDLADIEDSTEERNALEREALEIEQDLQRSLLRQQIANGEIADADEAQALLAQQQSAARERLRRAQLSPGQAYAERLAVDAENVNDALERIQVDALDDLNDGLVAAIQGTKSLGDVFSDIADQIIADLLRIAIQQAIIQPLANSLFGGDKGGGALSFLGSILGSVPGKAGGGAVATGRPIRVGESGEELFVPSTNGTIIPNGAMAGGGVATVRLQLSGDLDARIERVSGPVAVQVVRGAAPTLIDASATETTRRLGRPRL